MLAGLCTQSKAIAVCLAVMWCICPRKGHEVNSPSLQNLCCACRGIAPVAAAPQWRSVRHQTMPARSIMLRCSIRKCAVRSSRHSVLQHLSSSLTCPKTAPQVCPPACAAPCSVITKQSPPNTEQSGLLQKLHRGLLSGLRSCCHCPWRRWAAWMCRGHKLCWRSSVAPAAS